MNTQTLEAFKIRPAAMDDIPPVVEMFNAYSRWQTGKDQHTVEDITNEWHSPGFNLSSDTQLVLNEQGQPVAYMEFWDMGEPHVKFNGWGMVLPDYQRHGIGTYLLNWIEQRSRQAVPAAPTDARVVLHIGTYDKNESANALLTKRGYQHIRSFYRMQIDFNAPPPAPQLPEGMFFRSIQPGEERVAMRCIYDSFHDHWGFIEEPFDNYAERWLHFIENDKHYDPSLWFMVMDGDQVAGVSLCHDHITEDPEMGWVGSLGVRKASRRHGLGLALLLHSFGEFYRRGKPRAGLGVDASSLTGATRLYEKAGMAVSRKTHLYELELRPGKDFMTQTTG
jgi:GNAT superfamily N-acetyltransferase